MRTNFKYLESVIPAEYIRSQIFEPRTWFIDGLLTAGLNVISGKKGIGKTSFGLQALDAISRGDIFLGRNTKKCKVLYVPSEVDENTLHERLSSYGPLEKDFSVHFGWRAGSDGLEDASQAIDHGYRVILFDTFFPLLGIGTALYDYAIQEQFRPWRSLGQQKNAALVALWHDTKSSTSTRYHGDPTDGLLGSIGVAAQADIIINLQRRWNQNSGKIFVTSNHVVENAMPLSFYNCRWSLIATSSLNPGKIDSGGALLPLLDELAKHPEGITAYALADALGDDPKSLKTQLAKLCINGTICRIGKLARKTLYALREVDQQSSK